ncbi:hypothetical protein SETIT_7G052600v2 [Setaria italica]|uniref:Uncharacterized protein n=1 Tax=Setaria italica TaxID=4555 RepID=A0A368RU27_SETIT|nr:hypothetical protein SETIT_7G052600v2 [Setaria italica]
MAFEELLQLLASSEAVVAKQAEVMRLVMLATTESLASGEIVPGDPEFLDAAARAEALGLETLRRAAESVDKSTRMAAEYAAAPGGEAVVEAARRQAATAAALGAGAAEFAAFMRRVGALPAAPATASRPRRRNAKYFGPEWTN